MSMTLHPIETATAYVIGVDLADKVDYTAVVVLRQHAVPTGRVREVATGFDLERGTTVEYVPETAYHYDLIYADRWQGRGYKVAIPILQRLRDELERATFRDQGAAGLPARRLPVWTLIDHTSVGVAVLEDMRAAGLSDLVGVTFTSGTQTNRAGADYLVPKQTMISHLRVLVESQRIQLADTLALAPVIRAEFGNFRRITNLRTGHESFNAGTDALWREGEHDDLVNAAAMAAWFGEDIDPIRQRAQFEALVNAWTW